MNEPAFVDGTFTAPDSRRHYLTEKLLSLVQREARFRCLDLGCGTGFQLIDLASHFPHARLVGVDSSETNITAARKQLVSYPGEVRISFVQGDYMELDEGAFDVILADSVLQNVATPDSFLCAKLTQDLRPDGLLIFSMPYSCTYNRGLWLLRRGLRRLRGPAFEQFALNLAVRLHPGWNRRLLEERIPYLFMLPHRVDGELFAHSLGKHATYERIGAEELPHASPAQPKHRLSVFRKVAD